MPRKVRYESRWTPLVLLAIALLTTATTVALLDYSQRSTSSLPILLLAGTAGAAASSLGILLRPGGFTSLRNSPVRPAWLIAFVPPLAGFAAGAFSLLLAFALLTPVHTPRNAASAAVFGGIYGLLLGGWSQRLLESPVLEAAAPVVEETTQALKSAISSTADSLLLGRTRIKYDGRIGASIRDAEGVTLVQGILSVRFIPTAANQELEPGERSAQINVNDGKEAEWADFVITAVSDSALVSYPQSRAVRVPTDRASERFEFTLVREQETGDDKGDSDGKASIYRSVLVDVTQAGRTVQLLEVPMPGKKELDSQT